jgi:hypothetical protein
MDRSAINNTNPIDTLRPLHGWVRRGGIDRLAGVDDSSVYAAGSSS